MFFMILGVLIFVPLCIIALIYVFFLVTAWIF